jgi:hypothetical protein
MSEPVFTADAASSRRVLIVGALVITLVGAALVDRLTRPSSEAARPSPQQIVGGPAALGVDGGASTWFCPIANANANGGGADGTLVIANSGPAEVAGVITVFPGTGAPAVATVRVPPRARVSVHESSIVAAPVVGATVEMERGGVGVEQTVAGPLGESTTPCATESGTEWYVADGSTALGASLFLGVLNPYPDDAIIDLSFATDQGRASPGAFQGVLVAARSVALVDIGQHVRRRDHVAITLKARRGRVAVARLQTRTQPRSGLSLALAAPAPQKFWDFPDGIVAEAISERFNLYNPTAQTAVVTVELALDQGAAEPIEVNVPPRDRLLMDFAGESRVPKGIGHAVTVRSNVPIVAERTIDYVPPAPRIGLSNMLGATAQARHWLLPEGGASETQEEWVVVHNLSRRSLRVSLAAFTGEKRIGIPGFRGVKLAAGQRKVFRILDSLTQPELALVVDATAPVVVERVLGRVGRPGVSHSIAIPILD